MVVLETANYSEIEFSEYCREKGLYPEQVKEWKDVCMNANDSTKESNAKATKELREERKAKEPFEMPVFPDFSVLFQFWDGDEEFQPKILLLWDKVSLSYLHFETTYYLQGDLLKPILQQTSLFV